MPAEDMVSGFVGQVDSLQLIDIVNFYCMSGKSVGLVLRGPRGQGGEIRISSGQIVYARTGNLKGQAAFYEIAQWNGGQFSECRDLRAVKPNIAGKSSTGLILEAALLRDEMSSLAERRGGDSKNDVEAPESLPDRGLAEVQPPVPPTPSPPPPAKPKSIRRRAVPQPFLHDERKSATAASVPEPGGAAKPASGPEALVGKPASWWDDELFGDLLASLDSADPGSIPLRWFSSARSVNVTSLNPASKQVALVGDVACLSPLLGACASGFEADRLAQGQVAVLRLGRRRLRSAVYLTALPRPSALVSGLPVIAWGNPETIADQVAELASAGAGAVVAICQEPAACSARLAENAPVPARCLPGRFDSWPRLLISLRRIFTCLDELAKEC